MNWKISHSIKTLVYDKRTPPKQAYLAVILIAVMLMSIFTYAVLSKKPDSEPSKILQVNITPEDIKLSVGEHQLFQSHVTGGVEPYTYAWYSNGTLIGTEATLDFSFKEPCLYTKLSLEVTDNRGRFGYATVLVYDPTFTAPDLYLDDLQSTVKFTIETDGSYYWATRDDGHILDYGTSAIPVINNAMGNLTSDRTWKERILFKGDVEIDYNEAQINVPNYTIQDFAGSRLKVADDVAWEDDYGIFRNTGPCTDIEIRNLVFDENAEGAPDSWGYVIWLTNASNIVIKNCNISSPIIENCFKFDGQGEYLTLENNILDAMQFTDHVYHNHVTTRNNRFISATPDCRFEGDYVRFIDNEFGDYLAYPYVYGDHCIITSNYLQEGKIDVRGSDNIVSFNIVNQSQRLWCDGLCISGTNHTLIGNSLFSIQSGGNCGIRTSGNNSIIEANRIRTYIAGIITQGDNNTIANNNIESCQTSVSDSGTDNVFYNNIGFVTENEGVATDLADGGTIAHGLAGTPDVVTLTCLNATYDSVAVLVYWDKANTDATNISVDIIWSNSTAISDAVIDVSWSAVYEP